MSVLWSSGRQDVAAPRAITEFRFDVPGTYMMVDHSIFRAFDKGALGMIEVMGNKTPIFSDGADLPEQKQ